MFLECLINFGLFSMIKAIIRFSSPPGGIVAVIFPFDILSVYRVARGVVRSVMTPKSLSCIFFSIPATKVIH